MTDRQIVRSTTNRGEFNRAYKRYLEKIGKIRCSFCQYHDNENDTKKWYGGHSNSNGHFDMRYPSWKLVSKQPKQWMKKPIKIKEEISKYSDTLYIYINF